MEGMSDVLVDGNGEALAGYFVGGRPPSVFLLHDIFGLTNQIRGVARRFASEGYTVFAPDLFGRTTDDEARGSTMAQTIIWKRTLERLRVSLAALVAQAKGAKVAVIGFGFGGAMALATAANLPDVAACVTFYGIPTVDKGDLLRITAKVQGHFANQDKKFTRDRVDALEAKLKGASISVELFRYHTGHYFFNEMRKATHSPHNTALAYQRTVAFLKRELG